MNDNQFTYNWLSMKGRELLRDLVLGKGAVLFTTNLVKMAQHLQELGLVEVYQDEQTKAWVAYPTDLGKQVYAAGTAPAAQPAPEPEPRGAASVGAWTLPSEMVTPEVKAVFERQQAALDAERSRVRALEANERQYREIVTEFADELIGINTHTMTGTDALALLTRLHHVAVAMRKATASANGGGE